MLVILELDQCCLKYKKEKNESLHMRSSSLSKSQKRYCTTKKELLAVVTFVKHFKHYLYGQHFKIRTDHASLKWLKNFKYVEGMLARWLSVLDTYDYELEHRKGVHHGNADALSRKPSRHCKREDCPQCSTLFNVRVVRNKKKERTSKNHLCVAAVSELKKETQTSDQWLEGWSREQLREWQSCDPDIKRILLWKEAGEERPPWKKVTPLSDGAKAYWTQWKDLSVRDGVLYRKWTARGKEQLGSVWQLVTPNELRHQILEELHSSSIGGHLGITKTVDRVRRRFYWPGYKREIRTWCRKCDKCSSKKAGATRKHAPLQQEAVGAPMERVALDIIGPLKTTDKGNEYILVIDYFTKWMEAFPIPDHTAITVAECLVEQFISRYGVPRQLHSDQGPEFESRLFQEICRLLGIVKHVLHHTHHNLMA